MKMNIKMGTKSKFLLIIVAVLLGIVFLQTFHKTNIIPKITDTVVVVKTTYDTINKTTISYIPKWKTKTQWIHDTTQKIDTQYVIGDYYSTYFYTDSFKLHDTLHVKINDSVSKNKIKSRKISYTLKLPTNNITKTIIKKENNWYLGINLIGNKTGINYIGPEVLFKTKNKGIYGVGVGVDNAFKYNLNLQMYWKIK
jgi:hypothetical protein